MGLNAMAAAETDQDQPRSDFDKPQGIEHVIGILNKILTLETPLRAVDIIRKSRHCAPDISS